MQSIYTVDLENQEDPLCSGMIPESVFRISNLEQSVTTRTIIQCLSDLVDSRDQSVNFELYWCNETRFLVAATRKPYLRARDEEDIIREHGQLILDALKRRFPPDDIEVWKDYTAKRQVDCVEEGGTWSSSFYRFFWRMLGLASAAAKSGTGGKRDLEELEKPDRPYTKRRKIG
jgi:hypothetical protein